eukprot:TRINITY_DN1010_c0_g3_i1.p1 TRINITY_DN1010_c0_g3~~TRINITY_DN1010_c0_g3_i1.p1  ORF type:complete len:297 (+),score=126.89 TRINITY_DN1010_c0_g3_i1:71-961(+)
MPSRRWMWVRPTPHIYAYNREMSSFSSAAGASSATTAASEAIANARSLRASSEVNMDRSSVSRMSRATSVAPGTSLAGYTGYYGRQLALHRQAEESRRAETAAAKRAMAAASTAVSATSAATAASAASASISKTTTKVEAVKTSVQKEETSMQSQRAQLMRMQESSIKEGRQSVSRAVRRAEQHAESSGRDPRHIGVPRDTTDDILKKIADIHMTPYDSRELGVAKSALAQSKLKIDRMEKELNSITQSAMKFKSMYTKSAAQMAKEAMEASEAEAMSMKKTRKTVVEETKRVAAA